ncbi:MAG: T9SS type A sorting domain-containing protein [bacterium]
MKIYPNPVTTAFRVDMTCAGNKEIAIDLLDLNGRKVQTLHTGKVIEGFNSISLSMDKSIPAGLYILRVQGSGIHFLARLVVGR